MHTRFVLIHTSHAGNVGAVARAMKVMGFDDLVLVAPRWPDVLSRPEALDRASGATDGAKGRAGPNVAGKLRTGFSGVEGALQRADGAKAEPGLRRGAERARQVACDLRGAGH
jgi:hypothetical protein